MRVTTAVSGGVLPYLVVAAVQARGSPMSSSTKTLFDIAQKNAGPTSGFDQIRSLQNDESNETVIEDNVNHDNVCSVCGENRKMTMPIVMVDVLLEQGLASMTCQELEEKGRNGSISSIECPLIQPMVQDQCGCVSEETSGPVGAPSSTPPSSTANAATRWNNLESLSWMVSVVVVAIAPTCLYTMLL